MPEFKTIYPELSRRHVNAMDRVPASQKLKNQELAAEKDALQSKTMQFSSKNEVLAGQNSSIRDI